MSLVIIALPILTSLVLSDTSWNDKHLGYNNYLYTRLNIRKIFSRLFLSFITTFIICFVGFILNYLTLRFIFGSGNLISNFQELPYDRVIAPEFFLDSIRYYNPVLFIILISLHESVIIGLLANNFFILFIFYKAKINYLFSSYPYYDCTWGCVFFYWYQPVFNHKAVTAKFIVLGLSKYYFIYCTFFNSYYTSFVNYKERWYIMKRFFCNSLFYIGIVIMILLGIAVGYNIDHNFLKLYTAKMGKFL